MTTTRLHSGAVMPSGPASGRDVYPFPRFVDLRTTKNENKRPPRCLPVASDLRKWAFSQVFE